MDKKCLSLSFQIGYPQKERGGHMANIIDGIRKAEKEELAKQLCDFRLQKISLWLRLLGRYVYVAFMWVCRAILRLFKKDMNLPQVYSWKQRYEMKYEEYMLLEREALEIELIKQTKAKMRFIGRGGARTEDRLSAEVTKVVSGLYSGEEQKGLSILEKRDYICQNYLKKRRLDEKICILLGIIVSFFVCAVALIFWCFQHPFRLLIVLGCVVFVPVWGYFISHKVIMWQLAHLVWLSGNTSEENTLVESKSAPFSLKDENREKNMEELLIYHSLRAMEGSVSDAVDRALLADMLQVRESYEKEKLRRRWEKSFSKLEIKDEVFTMAVNLFAYEDFEKVEQRLFELCEAKDPAALAEKKKGEYKIPFKTGQRDVGNLYFIASRNKNKRLSVCRMERKNPLIEDKLSKNGLEKLLKEGENSIGASYQSFLRDFVPLEQKYDSQQQRIALLTSQVNDVELKLQQKKAEVLKITRHMEDRERKCEEIRDKLAKTGLTDSAYESQRQAFLKAQRELTGYKNDMQRAEKQLQEVRDEHDTFVSQREVLSGEAELLKEHILDRKKAFSEQIKAEVKEKIKDDCRDVDYLLGEMLIKKFSV